MLNILTLNLMQKASGSSIRSRLNDIVEYVGTMEERSEIFLIQEGCGGLVNLTFNSIRLLAKKLEKKLGKKFYYYSACDGFACGNHVYRACRKRGNYGDMMKKIKMTLEQLRHFLKGGKG